MKYVRFEDGFVIFPDKGADHPWHKDIARSVCRLGEVVSAGFVKPSNGEFPLECYGKSESLNVESQEEDSELLFKQLRNHDISTRKKDKNGLDRDSFFW